MNDWNTKANDIFAEAISLGDTETREEFIDRNCHGDQALRKHVDSLIDAHEAAPEFLDVPLVDRNPETTNSCQLEPPERVVGPYRLLQQIGEGGFGVVYLAEQKRPVRRRLALKIIKPGMDSREVIARFEAERQALAMMDHPNIAKVIDAGTTKLGRPFFVMELVKGIPITDFCDENKLSINERLDLFVSVCKAVQHAHRKGVIHRDLKPSNVLVTINDGEPMPKVIDFGVAKAIDQELTEKTLFTAYGQMVGTPQYMSPEQAQINAIDIDTRSDVYSLGVLLYELLTGVTPLDPTRLRSSGFDEMRRLIREEEALKPSDRLSTVQETASVVASHRSTHAEKLLNYVRGELDWIVLKCLEKDRSRRYDSPKELSEDLRRFLGDEPVLAAAPKFTYRVVKFYRRNRILVSTVALVAAALITTTIVTGLSAQIAWKQTNEANLARAAESEAKQELTDRAEAQRQRLYATDMNRVDQLFALGRIPDADLFRRYATDTADDLRGLEWRYFRDRSATKEILTIADDAISIRHVTVSADGRYFAYVADKHVVIRKATEPSEVVHEFIADYAWDLEFSPNGELLAVAMEAGGSTMASGGIMIFKAITGERIMSWEEASIPMQFSPDGELFGFRDRSMKIVDTKNWDTLKSLPLKDLSSWGFHRDAVEFSKDGRYFIYPNRKSRGSLRFYDLQEDRHDERFDGLVRAGLAVAVSPDSRFVAAAALGENTIQIFDLTTARVVFDLKGHDLQVMELEFAPDGSFLLSGGMDGSMKVWDGKTFDLLTSFTAGGVWSLGISPDGQHAYSADLFRVKVWPLKKIIEEDETIVVPGVAIGFANGSQFVTQLPEGGLSWYESDGTPVTECEIDFDIEKLSGVSLTRSADVSCDGQFLAFGLNDGLSEVWDSTNECTKYELSVDDQQRPIHAVAFHPTDPFKLATVTDNGDVRYWDIRKSSPIATINGPDASLSSEVTEICFSPDGRHLAICQFWRLRVYRISGDAEFHETFQREYTSSGLTFSTDGKYLGFRCGPFRDQKLTTVDTEKWKEQYAISTFGGHHVGVELLDDKTAITVDHGQAVKFWHLKTGTEMVRIRTDPLPVLKAKTFENGDVQLLISSVANNTTKSILIAK